MNKVVLSLMLLCGLSLSSAAQDNALLQRIRQRYNTEKQALRCDVQLAIYWSVREREERKSGTLLLAPGDRFDVTLDNTRWVSDGRTLWQFNPRTNQVVVKHLLDMDLSSHPSQILSTYLMDRTYTTRSTDKGRTVLSWKADAKSPSTFYTAITLTIDTKKEEILCVEVLDRSQNKTTYSFSKTIFNPALPKEGFTFLFPKGADILDVRE